MKRIEIRTTHDDPELIARSVSPDNTPEIESEVLRTSQTRTVSDVNREQSDPRNGGRILTTIERESTGGLRTTADDYVVNLAVATQVAQLPDRQTKSNHE